MTGRILSRVCGIIALGLLPLRANWGSDAGGSVASGTFRAFGTTQVEMVKEDLRIELYHDRARVHVDYVFRNTGPALDVTAGFPCLGIKTDKKEYTEIEDYKIDVDGRGVAYQVEPGDVTNWVTLFDPGFLKMVPDYEDEEPGEAKPCGGCRIWWLASTVHFGQGETKHIAIQYESVYQYSEGGPSDDSDYDSDHFRYVLATAGAWKGPIKSGRVTVKAVTIDPDSITINPQGRFAKTKDGFVWSFTSLKPTLADNIEVSMNNGFYARFGGGFNDPSTYSWYSFEGDKYYFDFRNYDAVASSEKDGYPASMLNDLERATAWATDKNGGIGESLTLTLQEPQHVDQIGIIPGFAKSKELYYANNRVRELDVTVNGRHVTTANLPDEYISAWPSSKKAYVLIDLGPYDGEARTITLTVRSVYPGRKHSDTCISEIMLRKRLPAKPEVHGAR